MWRGWGIRLACAGCVRVEGAEAVGLCAGDGGRWSCSRAPAAVSRVAGGETPRDIEWLRVTSSCGCGVPSDARACAAAASSYGTGGGGRGGVTPSARGRVVRMAAAPMALGGEPKRGAASTSDTASIPLAIRSARRAKSVGEYSRTSRADWGCRPGLVGSWPTTTSSIQLSASDASSRLRSSFSDWRTRRRLGDLLTVRAAPCTTACSVRKGLCARATMTSRCKAQCLPVTSDGSSHNPSALRAPCLGQSEARYVRERRWPGRPVMLSAYLSGRASRG